MHPTVSLHFMMPYLLLILILLLLLRHLQWQLVNLQEISMIVSHKLEVFKKSRSKRDSITDSRPDDFINSFNLFDNANAELNHKTLMGEYACEISQTDQFYPTGLVLTCE